jgi:hypothetical protein
MKGVNVFCDFGYFWGKEEKIPFEFDIFESNGTHLDVLIFLLCQTLRGDLKTRFWRRMKFFFSL